MKQVSRLTINKDHSAGAEFFLDSNKDSYSARKRPFIVCLSGYGIEAFRSLSIDDLVGIRDWIDRVLADHEVAA